MLDKRFVQSYQCIPVTVFITSFGDNPEVELEALPEWEAKSHAPLSPPKHEPGPRSVGILALGQML